jgi:hypothetical protein
VIRSSVLTWAGVVALIVVENFGAMAASDHVKIGILMDMSGAYSAITGEASAVASRSRTFVGGRRDPNR